MNTPHTYDRRSFLGISAGGTLLATLPAPRHRHRHATARSTTASASIDALYSAIYVTLKQGYLRD